MDGLAHIIVRAIQQYIAGGGLQLHSQEKRAHTPPTSAGGRHCRTCRCNNNNTTPMVEVRHIRRPTPPPPPPPSPVEPVQFIDLDELFNGLDDNNDYYYEQFHHQQDEGSYSDEESDGDDGSGSYDESGEEDEDFTQLRSTNLSPPPMPESSLPADDGDELPASTSAGASPHSPRPLGHRRSIPSWVESDSEDDASLPSSDQPPPKRACFSGVTTPPPPTGQASSSSGATPMALEDEDTVPWLCSPAGPSTTTGLQTSPSPAAIPVAVEDEDTDPWVWRLAGLQTDPSEQGSSFSGATPEYEDNVDPWGTASPSETSLEREPSSSVGTTVAIEDEDTLSFDLFIERLARCVDE